MTTVGGGGACETEGGGGGDVGGPGGGLGTSEVKAVSLSCAICTPALTRPEMICPLLTALDSCVFRLVTSCGEDVRG